MLVVLPTRPSAICRRLLVCPTRNRVNPVSRDCLFPIWIHVFGSIAAIKGLQTQLGRVQGDELASDAA